jgi:hypothetical protein
MRYVLVAAAILFYTGFIFSVAPLHVLIVWTVLVLLIASSIFGSRRGDRTRALQRQIFLNDSLLGYMEAVDDKRKRDQNP